MSLALKIHSILAILLPKSSYGLNTFITNETHWQSLSDFIPSYNTSYDGIYLQRALSMEYKFIYYGKILNSKHENVFRIGYQGKQKCTEAGTRYPSMWIHPTEDSFSISIAHSSMCWDQSIPYFSIQKHHPYQVHIQFNDTWRFVSVSDGSETTILVNQQRQSPTDPTLLHTFMNVWISSAWSPAANITLSDINIHTWNPITPTPTHDPTIQPTEDPTINPTTSPSLEPTLDPTTLPSSYPTLTPTINPTERPTTKHIVVFPPTHRPTRTPLNDAIVADLETTMSPFTSASVVAVDSLWMGMLHTTYIWLLVPLLVALFCLVFCVLIYIWKKNTIIKANTPASAAHKRSANEVNDFDDIIFDKIYNQQIQNIAEERDLHYESHRDILLPNEDSLSTDAAEELFIPQTSTTKNITSVDLNVSVKAKHSYSFNSKQRKSPPHEESDSNDLEFQHQVTMAVSDQYGFKAMAVHSAEGYIQHKHVSDTEDDEDVDVYHVNVPSSGPSINIGTFARNRLIRNKRRKIVPSESQSPEQDIYSKPTISGTGNEEQEELYGKGKDPLKSPGDDKEGLDDYRRITYWLKVCDKKDWKTYLLNFKRNKVNDYRIHKLNEKDWNELIPSIGPRNEFRALWSKYEKGRSNSMHL